MGIWFQGPFLTWNWKHCRFPDTHIWPGRPCSSISSIAGVLSLGTTGTLDQTILCGQGLSVICRMFSSSYGLYSLRPIVPPHSSQAVTIKNIFRHCQMSPGGGWGNGPSWELLQLPMLSTTVSFSHSCFSVNCPFSRWMPDKRLVTL